MDLLASGVVPDAELADRLRTAVTRLARRLRHQASTGLTASQSSALASVERLGRPTLGELAACEQVQPPSITRCIASLEAAGLVRRVPDDVDRRVARVDLTAEGRRTLHRNRSRRTAYLAERLAALPAADRDRLGELVALLEQLVDGR